MSRFLHPDKEALMIRTTFAKKISREFNFNAFSSLILTRISIELQLIYWCLLL